MKKLLILMFFLQFICLLASAQVSVKNLLTENLTNPVGVDAANPRFTWQLITEKRNVIQSAYEIKVLSGKTVVWNSGKILSTQSVHVPYEGSPLQSGKKYTWQVRVWDKGAKGSAWSQPAYFQMALLKATDWKARWIEPVDGGDQVMRPSPLMRKQFAVNKKIVSATAFITAHGMYEAHLNGERVGDAYLTPGWTAYRKRLQYQVYDVTGMLKTGANVLGVTLGNGWYRGIIGFSNNMNVYGKDIALLCQIDIAYADGTSETIISDETWKSSTGTIMYAEIYNGETIDARQQKTGWNLPGYDDSDWIGVKAVQHDMNILVPTRNEMVKKQETFVPARIFKTPAGEQVIDFGQNLVGWVIMKVSGKAGDKVVLSHAEVLDKAGNFYTENLRQAKAQDTYILKGGGSEVFEPHFTWHGFRYLKIEGYPGEIRPENFTAVALYSDMNTTGTFNSSNALINQLQHNIQWGQKGNFLDVPVVFISE